MPIQIVEDFVPMSSNHRPGIKRTGFRGVTIHETGNRSKGAGAKSHNIYYHNLAKTNALPAIGYHYFVDDTLAYLEMPNNEVAWTNGDGHGDGNMKTVSIEICVNPESNFAVARDNGAYIAAKELHDNGIHTVIDGVADMVRGNLFQHWCWSPVRKNCPETIRKQGLWGEFVQAVQRHLNELWGAVPQAVAVSAPVPISVSDMVRIKPTATQWAKTVLFIPSWAKSRVYRVAQVDGDKALLAQVNSWVYLRDIERA